MFRDEKINGTEQREAAQARDEIQGIEAFGQYLVEKQQGGHVVSCQGIVYDLEIIFVVQYVEIPDHVVVLHVLAAECHYLVKYGQGIPHGSVGLYGYDVQAGAVDGYAFLGGYVLQVAHYVGDGYAVEVKCGSILCFSVVARMKMAWAGGSSRVFRKALNAAEESMWTSSMM